ASPSAKLGDAPTQTARTAQSREMAASGSLSDAGLLPSLSEGESDSPWGSGEFHERVVCIAGSATYRSKRVGNSFMAPHLSAQLLRAHRATAVLQGVVFP